MTSHSPGGDTRDDEIDLRDLIRVVWSGKWLIAAVTAVSTAVAIGVALLLPSIYRAEALLVPNEQDGAAGMSALAAQYGGLAALAGINIGGGSSDKAELALKVLESRQFIGEFVANRNILVPLMAAKGWRAENGELIIDADLYDVAEQRWVRRAASGQESKPSMQEAYEEFRDRLAVIEDRNSGFVTVAFEHRSPIIAKQWVDWLVEDLNATLMRHDVAQAEQSIKYLNDEIAKTSLAELQKVFFNLIEEQTKIVMLARVSPEYVFRTVDPAVVPEKRSKPNRLLVAALGILVGVTLGVGLVLVRSNRRPLK